MQIHSIGTRDGKRWTNWVGCATCLSIAALAAVRAPRATLLVLLPSFLLELLSAVAFLIRRPLRRQSAGFLPHFTAYLAGFGTSVFIMLARKFEPQWLVMSGTPAMRFIGLTLWVLGTSLALLALWRLKYSFSIVPQARELVTSGPYQFVRHPVYTCYIIQGIGYALAYANWPMTILQFAWLGLIVVRARFEEQVLEQVFPAYAQYRRQAGMFWPRLRIQKVRAAVAASQRQAA
jgi:protein-S-isoprenylcysteine O-methyltransferase Ste14